MCLHFLFLPHPQGKNLSSFLPMQLASALRFRKRRQCIVPNSRTSYALWARFVDPQNEVCFRPLQETSQQGNHKTATHGCFNFGAAIMGSQPSRSRNFSWPTANRLEEGKHSKRGRTSNWQGLSKSIQSPPHFLDKVVSRKNITIIGREFHLYIYTKVPDFVSLLL